MRKISGARPRRRYSDSAGRTRWLVVGLIIRKSDGFEHHSRYFNLLGVGKAEKDSHLEVTPPGGFRRYQLKAE